MPLDLIELFGKRRQLLELTFDGPQCCSVKGMFTFGQASRKSGNTVFADFASSFQHINPSVKRPPANLSATHQSATAEERACHLKPVRDGPHLAGLARTS